MKMKKMTAVLSMILIMALLTACTKKADTTEQTPSVQATEAAEAAGTEEKTEAAEAAGTEEKTEAAEAAGTEKTAEDAGAAASEETGAPEAAEKSTEVSNKLFSITLPDKAAGLFVSEITENGISIYDKEAKEAEFGGFAFNVSAYKEPSEYAGGMDSKVGEYRAADGTLYDIVVSYPSDVQYDYTKNTDGMPESYEMLYRGAEDIIKTLKGSDGSGEFIWGAGTKGEDLYGDVLKKHVQAVNEKWDANRLEEEGLSPEYYALSVDGENVLEKVGYAYFDENHDGVDELFIGVISDGDMKGVAYDIYTMVNRKPEHVVSGTARNRYYALNSGMLVNEHSDGANAEGWDIYDIEPNTTNLMDQVKMKIDRYENEEKPWFVSYDNGETWESQDEKEFEDYKANFSDYMRFDFTPLSSVQGAD